jgi:hypothetical protein
MPTVDPERIYIMGLSMGGMGVYEAISRHRNGLQRRYRYVEVETWSLSLLLLKKYQFGRFMVH